MVIPTHTEILMSPHLYCVNRLAFRYQQRILSVIKRSPKLSLIYDTMPDNATAVLSLGDKYNIDEIAKLTYLAADTNRNGNRNCKKKKNDNYALTYKFIPTYM